MELRWLTAGEVWRDFGLSLYRLARLVATGQALTELRLVGGFRRRFYLLRDTVIPASKPSARVCERCGVAFWNERKQRFCGTACGFRWRRQEMAEAFERFVVRNTEGCWAWKGWTSEGYGRFSAGGRIHAAHRVSYELFVGPIPAGLTIDHLCGNPPCTRPEHLEAVTLDENIRRAGRSRTICRHGHALAETRAFLPDGSWRCSICALILKDRWRSSRPPAELRLANDGYVTAFRAARLLGLSPRRLGHANLPKRRFRGRRAVLWSAARSYAGMFRSVSDLPVTARGALEATGGPVF